MLWDRRGPQDGGAPAPPPAEGPRVDISICQCACQPWSFLVHWGRGLPVLRLPPPQCGPRSRALGPSSMMPGPRRSSWQPESRRCRPCWPWTQVGGAPSRPPPSLLVLERNSHPPCAGIAAASAVQQDSDGDTFTTVPSRMAARAADGNPITGGSGLGDLPLVRRQTANKIAPRSS